MKPYKRRLLALSIIFALGVFMLVYIISKSGKSDTDLDYGLPKGYRCIDVSCMNDKEHSHNISYKIILMIKEDEDVIALFNAVHNNGIYLYDPSGYYSQKYINGKYFSKKDFIKSDGSSALIYENSAYSLMMDEGNVYAIDRERRVIGTYSKEHPIYKYNDKYNNDTNIICDFNFDNEDSGMLYLSNCSDQMVANVKETLINNGWDVFEERGTYPKVYPGLSLPGENFKIPSGMLTIFAFAMLLCITHAESSNGIRFGRGMRESLLPIASGSFAGCAIGLVIIAALIHKMLWNIWGIALAASLGIMLALAAVSWIIFGELSGASILRKDNLLLKQSSGKAAVIFLMAAIFFTASYAIGAVIPLRSSLKVLPYEKRIEGYDLVSFNKSYKDNAGENFGYTDKICTTALNAIENGQAFSVFSDGSATSTASINLNVVLGPLMQINGLEKPKNRYSLYLRQLGMDFITERNIEIVNLLEGDDPHICAIVQDRLPDGVNLRVSPERMGYNFGLVSFITMSVEDYKSCRSSMSYVPTGLCFINPTRQQLEEYMALLVEEGFHVTAQRWNGRAEGKSIVGLSNVLAMGIIALSIVLEVLLWAAQAVRMFLSSKKQEFRVLELYGASSRIIERNAFLLSAAIVMPGILLSAVILPIQGWRYLGIEYVDVKLFYIPSLKSLIGFLAAGIVFAFAVAWGQFSINLKIKSLWRGI